MAWTQAAFVNAADFRLSCGGEIDAFARFMHCAFQYPAILVHLAQFALGIDFVPAVYQQVIHNQSTACAYAESIFYNR
jgi:hypothetical protein